MAVPSSGQLRLRADIALEVDGSATGDNVSLGTLSNTAEFTEPDTMSEFYSYVAAEEATFSSISFSNVYDTSMRASVTITNPSELHIDFGYYFGTSTNMTSNTKYTVNDNTASTINFYRDMTGLSATTTYYCWTWCTYRNGEFSESSSSMNTQTTLQSYTFSQTSGGSSQEIEVVALQATGSSSAGYQVQYNHPYYGWTTDNSAGASAYAPDANGASQSVFWQCKVPYRSGASTSCRLRNYWSGIKYVTFEARIAFPGSGATSNYTRQVTSLTTGGSPFGADELPNANGYFSTGMKRFYGTYNNWQSGSFEKYRYFNS